MITISPSKISREETFVKISSTITINGSEKSLWYEFPSDFEDVLVTENLDAFLVGVLFLGLKTGQSISVEGTVSGKLYYSITHYLIPAFALADSGYEKINIYVKDLNYLDLNTHNVAGTGMSCGIDSFATYFDHLNEVGPFAIEYFTFFNVGSHLDYGGEKARKIFQKRLKSVSDFAQEEGKKVISVDSNLSEILEMNFQQTHSLRSISCILHLQKLFKNFYYSSAYRFDYFKLNPKDTSDSDIFNLHMLSTESTSFYASAAQYSRVQRTLSAAKFSATHNRLDVCTDPELESSFVNCSKCYKCMRTQLTLDLNQKLELYQNVFDIKVYKRERDKYVGELLVKEKSVLDLEVYKLLKDGNFKYSPWILFYSLNYVFIKGKKNMKRFLKR